MSKRVTLEPNIKSLLFGLRSIGYTFSSAVADIIDNSISSEADKIEVLFDVESFNPYFQILDNGCGMSDKELENALLMGSNRDGKQESELELGRFGLGLKTASISQCSQLTVVSKKNNIISAVLYDIEHMEKVNKWEVLFIDKNQIDEIPNIEKLKSFENGTIVMWTNFDRLRGASKHFVESFREVIANSKEHCEFVFHRFYNKVSISFNGRQVNERDPFLCNSTPKVQVGVCVPIELPEHQGAGFVTAYTLPYFNDLSLEEKKLLGNPKSIYDEQGFYIYRNKRLIIWGSWLRMGYKNDFNKHARIKVDIPSTWDEVWDLDVKKASAKVPDILKSKIEIAVRDGLVKSKRIPVGKSQKEGNSKENVWIREEYRDGAIYRISKDNPLYLSLCEELDEEKLQLLNIFLKHIELCWPTHKVTLDNSNDTKIYNNPESIDGNENLERFILAVKTINKSEQFIDTLLETEGFRALKLRKDEIMRRLKDEI